MEELLKQSLQRLHLFHCRDSTQFLATVHSLPYLLTSAGDIRVVMVDPISSFFWIDRMESETKNGQQAFYQRQFVRAMKPILQSFRLILFATKQALFFPPLAHQQYPHGGSHPGDEQQQQQQPGSPSIPLGLVHREYMCPTWRHFVKYRFCLSKLEGAVGARKFIGKIIHPADRRIYYLNILEGF
jgi:DNA-repair protein XRCC2